MRFPIKPRHDETWISSLLAKQQQRAKLGEIHRRGWRNIHGNCYTTLVVRQGRLATVPMALMINILVMQQLSTLS